jgi:hypothetical protein
MPQVSLERPRVDAVIRKLVAAGVAQHVSVRLDAEIGCDRRALDHAREARRRARPNEGLARHVADRKADLETARTKAGGHANQDRAL